jgi:hypothetical protein
MHARVCREQSIYVHFNCWWWRRAGGHYDCKQCTILIGCDVLHASLMHTSQCRPFSNKPRACHALRRVACVTALTILNCRNDVWPGTFTNCLWMKMHSSWLVCTVYSLSIVWMHGVQSVYRCLDARCTVCLSLFGCTVYSLPIVVSLNMPGCPSTRSPRLRRSNDFLLPFHM